MAQPRSDVTSRGSVLSNLYGALSKVVGGLWQRYGGWGWSRVRLLLPGARFDWEREAGDPWSNPIVALAIEWLGNRFPRPRMFVAKISAKGDHIPIEKHPLTDLWRKPNPYYSRRTMEKAIGLSLKTDGNAYIYKVRDNGGKIVELWWVPHFRILPTWPSDGSVYIDGYRVWLDNAVYHLPPEDIVHIRDGIDPRNERLGISALKACMREVCTVNEEAGYTAALLKNSGVPALMVIPDDPNLRPSKEDAERVKERIRDGYSGERAGDTVVMAGKYKIQSVGFSPDQMALDKLPQIATSRISAAMGVAPMSMGLADPGKTYSNLAEANRGSWGTVISIQELIGEAVRWNLLPEFGIDPMIYSVDYDYSQIQEMQESLDALHTRVRSDFIALLIRKNEARELLGFDPDPDGDVWYSLPAQTVSTDDLDTPNAPQDATDTPAEATPDDETEPAPKKKPANGKPAEGDDTEESATNGNGKAISLSRRGQWRY